MDTRTWGYTVQGGKVEGRIFPSPEDIPDGWTRSLAEANEWLEDADEDDASTATEIAKGIGKDAERAALKAAIRQAGGKIPRGQATLATLRQALADAEG